MLEEKILDYYRTWDFLFDLEVVKRNVKPLNDGVDGRYQIWVDCPFGIDPGVHFATVSLPVGSSHSSEHYCDEWMVLFCACCDKHAWAKLKNREIDISQVLLDEEIKFSHVMERFKKYGAGSVTPEKAVKMWHSQGCPLEIVEEIVTDWPRCQELIELHNATGRKGFKGSGAYA